VGRGLDRAEEARLLRDAMEESGTSQAPAAAARPRPAARAARLAPPASRRARGAPYGEVHRARLTSQ
jgi:hypothetical protein